MNPWLVVSALSLVALWLRTGNLYSRVFGEPGLVNFIESDAWWHVRVIEHMARNFPFRMTLDPYGRIDGGQPVDTGIFYDALPAALAWAARLSPEAIHQLAAWYPAVLGVLLVPVTFLCGRAIFSSSAGLWAAAVVATLPGHFLNTGSLGFTDHHVMEALLTSVLLWLLTREPRSSPWKLGAALTAYLLTFPGGAFVVAIITFWYWLQAACGDVPESRNFALACLIAAPFTYWQVRVYLMRYSLAAVVLAAAGLWLLPVFAAWCQRQARPTLTFLGISATGGAVTLAALSAVLSGEESIFAVVGRMTAAGPLAGTVGELQSLTRMKGFFSLEYPWREFGGALVGAIAALPLLAESAWRRPTGRHLLFLLWAATFFVMAMTQARMTYYFGVSAALLSGYLMSQLRARSWAALALAAFLIVPNAIQAVTDQRDFLGQVTPDWREALQYLRERTPEPFGDPKAFQAWPRQSATYSVLGWWDYGYWITAVGRRVPVTNPTQGNVEPAAKFFLATAELPALYELAEARVGYIVVDHRLPFLGDERAFRGYFANLFAYTKSARVSDYMLPYVEPGQPSRVFFRASYFRTMLVRLYLSGGQGLPASQTGKFAVIEAQGDRVQRRRGQFDSLAEAQAASQCAGCEVVSENPLTPCVDLDPVPFAEPVFESSTSAIRWPGRRRAEVQIYRVR